MDKILITEMKEESWPEVQRIYNEGIATKNATYETEAPEWDAWNLSHRKDCRLIALNDKQIAGWAALSIVSGRSVYSGVAEVSVYIDADFRGMGVGNQLMKQLITDSERNGIWTLQSGIFPENKASMALHIKHGFRIVGTREKVGKMEDVWRDTILLERRSKVVGVD